jgi:alpha-mannosidase
VETVVREAWALNVPLIAAGAAIPSGAESIIDFCRVSDPHLIVDTVKKAEEDDAIIVRFYEAGNTRGIALVSFSRPVKRSFHCNLMEENGDSLTVHGDEVELSFTPFEIKTIKVYFR